jgi:hypothetical protein
MKRRGATLEQFLRFVVSVDHSRTLRHGQQHLTRRRDRRQFLAPLFASGFVAHRLESAAAILPLRRLARSQNQLQLIVVHPALRCTQIRLVSTPLCLHWCPTGASSLQDVRRGISCVPESPWHSVRRPPFDGDVVWLISTKKRSVVSSVAPRPMSLRTGQISPAYFRTLFQDISASFRIAKKNAFRVTQIRGGSKDAPMRGLRIYKTVAIRQNSTLAPNVPS